MKRALLSSFRFITVKTAVLTIYFHGYVDKNVKKQKLSHSNLINKANRQTIEAFLEKGVWKIGNGIVN